MTAKGTATSLPDFNVPDFLARAQRHLHKLPPAHPSADAPRSGDDRYWKRPLTPQLLANARDAAVLIPVIAHSTEPTILLTQRSSQLNKHSGQIAFPGGKIDPDESPLQAALREAEEEIGLASHLIEPLGYLDYYFTGTGYRIAPVVALIAPSFEIKINPDEVEDVFEVPLSFLMQSGNHHRVKRGDEGRSFLAMPYADRFIWGATAGMLRQLYERLYQ
jgi:8-oxo-dGTP pyrophosphatase MutT (NUDIX family)